MLRARRLRRDQRDVHARGRRRHARRDREGASARRERPRARRHQRLRPDGPARAARRLGPARAASSSTSTSSRATPRRARTCSSSTPSTAAGRTRSSAVGGALEVDGTPIDVHGGVPSPGDGAVGASSASTSCSSAPGKFRTPAGARAVTSARRAQGHRRGAGQGSGALNIVMGVNDDAATTPTPHDDRDRGLVHDQLPGARREGRSTRAIGIRHGLITTMHDMTNTQTIVDAPHKDLRRARAAVALADPDDAPARRPRSD